MSAFVRSLNYRHRGSQTESNCQMANTVPRIKKVNKSPLGREQENQWLKYSVINICTRVSYGSLEEADSVPLNGC